MEQNSHVMPRHYVSGRNHKSSYQMKIAAWNIRTLQDNPLSNRPERRTALIANELNTYDIDIAALSETRFAESGQLTEKKGGYTYFWSGRKLTEKRESGVGFAIRSSLLYCMDKLPIGINDRIITARFCLRTGKYLTLVSIYAPTMKNDEEIKEKFYEDLRNTLDKIPRTDKLLLLGDFNARVGKEASNWPKVIGQHGTGKCNSNGLMLLTLCQTYGLTISNTIFQMADKYKNTWMHPRSKHWHMIDYIITKTTDIKDVTITRVMRGAIGDTDHRLVRSKLNLRWKKIEKRPTMKRPKINVASLSNDSKRTEFEEAVETRLLKISTVTNQSSEELWANMSSVLYDTSIQSLGKLHKKNEDWFDENNSEIINLIQHRKTSELKWQDNKTPRNKEVMLEERRKLRIKIRTLKNKWWTDKANEIQQYADTHNLKSFYQSLRQIYGPRRQTTMPLKSKDNCKTLNTTAELLSRWREHFNELLNMSNLRDETVTNLLPQYPLLLNLDQTPTEEEIASAIKRLNNGKAPGADGIPSEILKYGGVVLLQKVTYLVHQIWDTGAVPQNFKNAVILPLYKNKGNKNDCDNYRGISLLSSVGKILSNILNERLTTISEYHNPESQTGFRKNRGCSDMIFTLRQLQEKCVEQNQPFYACFVDFSKAFDTVPRNMLWKILEKFGCPPNLLHLVQSLHNNTQACVSVNGEQSDAFSVTIGTRQGCVLAPTLFNIFLTAVLEIAFCDYVGGVYIRYRTDGGLHNLSRFRATSKLKYTVVQHALYADDCALVACNPEDLQDAINRLATSSSRFGLKINLSKTEIMARPLNANITLPNFFIGDSTIKSTDSFKYLGSVLCHDGNLDLEVNNRIAAASRAFGSLRKRVWQNHDLNLNTKLIVYRAVVLPTLLYASETWTPYRRHIKSLEKFHQRCLRSILRIKWQDHVDNVSVLNVANATSIESLIMKNQLRWTGHVVRMSNDRLPKQVLYSELQAGQRSIGAPRKRYKDVLNTTLKATKLNNVSWEILATSRNDWRRQTSNSITTYEESRQQAVRAKAAARKNRTSTGDNNTNITCHLCGRQFVARIGLVSHLRAHQRRRSTTV